MNYTESPQAQPLARDPVETLAEEFLERYRRGELPAISEFIALAPEHAEEIRDLFPALILMEKADPAQATALPSAALSIERLGDYRIIREVGRGGMGIVYEAEQEALGRRVALKVLLPTAANDNRSLLRFHREARAAARLHHTNIVPVFDVGERDGIHYYAMQFIQGQGLNDVIDELRCLRAGSGGLAKTPSSPTAIVAGGLLAGQFHHDAEKDAAAETRGDGLSSVLTDRSEFSIKSEWQFYRSVAHLGMQVADALAYAHGERMLHRDIKPANLLLDTRGAVWVTDFGLAKEEGDDLTRTGDIVGTLRYLAPERLNGISNACSDIYSLGLTLYELLTQQPAFAETDRVGLMRAITHQEPIAPRRLDPHLPRDLETIILKAIAKEPAARYASAADMRDDLQCYLADRPIHARRTSVGERVRRWCRRNPGWAATIAGVFGLLVIIAVGGAVLSWQLQLALSDEHIALQKVQKAQSETQSALEREQSARKRARRMLARLSDRVVEDWLARKAQLTTEDKKFLREILADYEALAAESGDTEEAQALRAEGLFRVGLLRYSLGELSDAETAYQACLSARNQLVADCPEIAEYRVDLAKTYNNLGVLHNATGRPENARIAWRRSLDIQSKLAVDFPHAADYRVDLARSYTNLGILLMEINQFAEAKDALEQGLKLRKALVAELPNEADQLLDLAGSYHDMGVLLHGANHLAEAETAYRTALDLRTRVIAESPTVPRYRQVLARNQTSIGTLLWMIGRTIEAETAYRDALGIQTKLTAEFPSVPQYRQELATTQRNLGILLGQTLRSQEAQHAIQTALEIQTRLVANFSEVPQYRHDLALTLQASGQQSGRLGQLQDAEEAYRAAQEIQSRLTTDFPARPRFRLDLAATHNELGLLHLQASRLDDADTAFQAALEIQTRLEDDYANLIGLKASLGGTLVNQAIVRNNQKAFADARQKLTEARTHLRAALQANPQDSRARQFWRNCCWNMCGAHLGLMDHAELAKAAHELAAFNFEPIDAYRAAGYLSHGVSVAGKDPALSNEQRLELTEKYGSQAVELLRKLDRSVQRNRQQLETDVSLAPLKTRADFKQLLADLDIKPSVSK